MAEKTIKMTNQPKGNNTKIIIPLFIYIAFLAVIYTGLRPYAGSDALGEIRLIQTVLESGWDIGVTAHANTCLPLTVVAPFLSKTFGITPLNIHRGIFPFIFALTPVLLYFVFLRVMSPSKALLSALFFIVLPPTYQEVPSMAKSMIAQPIAAGALFLLLSKDSVKIKTGAGAILVLLTPLCHYTVGVMLLVWLGISAVIARRKSLLMISSIIGVISFGYFSMVAGGTLVRGITNWGTLPDRSNDAIVKILQGEEVQTYADGQCTSEIATVPEELIIKPWHLPFKVPSVWKTIIIYFSAIMLFLGGIYWITHKEYLFGHKELSAMMVFSALTIILALYVPFFTRGLFISRWIQIGSIPMSGLYGVSTYWLPSKWAYPIASIILIALLVVVR